jgi:hypothetical protein
LRYAEAATHFPNPAAVVSPKSAHEDKRIGYLAREATALYLQGYEFTTTMLCVQQSSAA